MHIAHNHPSRKCHTLSHAIAKTQQIAFVYVFTSMSLFLAALKSSSSSALVRVVYLRNSSQPAFKLMAVGLHLQQPERRQDRVEA